MSELSSTTSPDGLLPMVQVNQAALKILQEYSDHFGISSLLLALPTLLFGELFGAPTLLVSSSHCNRGFVNSDCGLDRLYSVCDV